MYRPRAPRYPIWINPPSPIKEAAIAARSHSISRAKPSRTLNSSHAIAVSALAYAFTSPSTIITNLVDQTAKQNANLWLYPPKENVQLHGTDHLSIYQFATKAAKHSFCSTCGVEVANQFELPLGVVLESKKEKLPINVRAINGIDLKALKIKKVDGKSFSL